MNSIIPLDRPIMEPGPGFQKSEPVDLPKESRTQHQNFQNPIFQSSAHWSPWSDGGRISEKVKGELADEARALYDTWQKRIAYRAQIVSDSEKGPAEGASLTG